MTDVIANAGNVKIVITGDGSNFSQVVADVNRKLEEMGVKGRAASGHLVSGTQAASGSIRILEGNVENNVRAVERFMVSTLKLGPILQAAFPIVGAVAFGGIILEIGKKVYDFVESGRHAGTTISQGFDEIAMSVRKAGVDLDLTNDKLQVEIAKLEHKPANLLKLALDEDRKAAYDFAAEMGKLNDATAKFLDKNNISEVKQLGLALLGSRVTSTTPDTTRIKAENSTLTRAGIDAVDREDRATPENRAAVTAANRKTIGDAFDLVIKNETDALADLYKRQAIYKGVDFSANTAMSEKQIGDVKAARHNAVAEYDVSDQGVQLKGDEDKRQRATDALEAERKAAQAMRQSADSQLAEVKENHTVSVAEEVGYWNSVLAAVKSGSEPFLAYRAEINKRIGDLVQEQHKKLDSAQSRRVSLQTDNGGVEKFIQQQKALMEATDRATEANIRQQEKLQIGGAELARGSGNLTGVGYNQAVAAAHTQAYGAQRDELAQDLARLDGLADQDAARMRLSSALTELEQSRQLQQQQDARLTSKDYNNPMVGATDALNDFVDASRDAAKSMREIVTGTLDSLNGQILRGMSGQRTDFSNMGAGVFRSVAGAGLKTAEGSALSLLGGFGSQADGSQSRPFWIRDIADAHPAPANGVLSVFNRLFGGARAAAAHNTISSLTAGANALATTPSASVTSTIPSKSTAGATVGSLASKAISFIPFLADGGPVVRNVPAIVGERGPELFMPPSAGRIVPNRQLGGGDVTHQYNIDARGASDPAATNAAVYRGIARAMPQILGASLAAAQDQRRRSPLSKG